jgi:MFS family permease
MIIHDQDPHAPSPAWILFFLSASVGVAMIGLGIIWPLVPVYAVELGASGFQVGLIIATFNIARTVFNPISGRLSDHWGRKPFIVLGLFLYAAVSVLYVMSSRVDSLILVRLLHGFTSVLVVPVALALAADIAPQQRLGLYMGTLNMAVMLGLGIGPVLGGFIRDFFGMPVAFYTMGGLGLFTLIGVTIFLPRDNRQYINRSEKPVAPLKRLLKHRVVQGLFLLRFFIAAGQGSVYTFLPILALRMQITSFQVGLILGANIFLIAFLQRVCGNIADRVNPKNMIIWGTLLSGLRDL